MEVGIIVSDYSIDRQDAILTALREYGLEVMVRENIVMDLDRTQKMDGKWVYKYKPDNSVWAQGDVTFGPEVTPEQVAQRIADAVRKANGADCDVAISSITEHGDEYYYDDL